MVKEEFRTGRAVGSAWFSKNRNALLIGLGYWADPDKRSEYEEADLVIFMENLDELFDKGSWRGRDNILVYKHRPFAVREAVKDRNDIRVGEPIPIDQLPK